MLHKISFQMSDQSSLCDLWFSQTLRLKFDLYISIYSRVTYIYVRSRAKYLKFRTTASKINTLRKPLMQQKYYFIHEM